MVRTKNGTLGVGLIQRLVMVHCVWDLNLDKIDQVVGVIQQNLGRQTWFDHKLLHYRLESLWSSKVYYR